jgi:trehalose 6-phosphate phosphatase
VSARGASRIARILAALPAGRPLLLLLDYDGTLVPFAPEPGEARPDAGLRSLLTDLGRSADRKVILVSGRPGEDLRRLFDDDPISALALHGAQFLEPGHPTLELIDLAPARQAVRRVAEAAQPLLRIRGVILEDKGAALALHTRACGREDEGRAVRLFLEAASAAVDSGDLSILKGERVVELKPGGADKGTAVLWLLGRHPDSWFPLYAGDDVTDEDAFGALQGRGVTLRVGMSAHPSRARFRLRDPQELRRLLELLAR